MRSSNPVLTRLTPEASRPAGYPSPAYGAPAGYPGLAPSEAVVSPATDRMTIDDAVVKTVTLLGITAVSAAAAWVLNLGFPVLILGIIGGLVLNLVITFKRSTSPGLIIAYAVVEGLVVGIISHVYNSVAGLDGIVTQALFGTFGIFFVMVLLYRSKVLRATPRFTKFVTVAVIGAGVFYLVSLLIGIFSDTNPLRSGPLGIVISLVLIAIASMTFVLDFAEIERAAAEGAPKNYAWLCGFGILVSLIWLYLEILRLLSMLRGDD